MVEHTQAQALDMEWKTIVEYKGELAHYQITDESSGIYYAQLLKYEGRSGETPPQSILLVKGVTRWTGSYDQPYFMQQLGNAIEERKRSGDPSS